jgi:hypothetical protein
MQHETTIQYGDDVLFSLGMSQEEKPGLFTILERPGFVSARIDFVGDCARPSM